MRPRQVETDSASKNNLHLAQEIGVLFADAFRKELERSGHRMEEQSDHVVSGTIIGFYLDWKSEQDRSFELVADQIVRSGERAFFIWHRISLQKGPKMMAEDGILIREGIADCIHRFSATAQEAGPSRQVRLARTRTTGSIPAFRLRPMGDRPS